MVSVKTLSISLFGLLSATLLSAPVFAQNAASVVQSSDQSVTQVGQGNQAIQGNLQTANVTQTGVPFPFSNEDNSAFVLQNSQQQIDQLGNANSAIQGNAATADVRQGTPKYPFYYPTPSSNDAIVQQANHQNIRQHGYGNTGIQGSATDASVIQH